MDQGTGVIVSSGFRRWLKDGVFLCAYDIGAFLWFSPAVNCAWQTGRENQHASQGDFGATEIGFPAGEFSPAADTLYLLHRGLR
jgi:hypothetical protein